ncbi:hypothetical protein [Adlercreutzia mucosicola]|uniref:hypothetical protein n=1 Tax=Adlercreutzia mucosicola TaxID=580026 RepID=UPI00041AA622|nr:hypothetical protein [Adlercreutzia mucosicola]MCR2034138.1 hypothetical protein [Adlercreutzia mucosicola]
MTDHNPAIAIAYDTTQITSSDNGSNPADGDPCHVLSSSGHPPLLCMAGDEAKSSVDDDLCGTLKCGGGVSNRRGFGSNGSQLVGTLAARDYKGVCDQDISQGKVILQWM